MLWAEATSGAFLGAVGIAGGDLRSIVVTESVVENAQARSLLETKGLTPAPRRVTLSGIADKVSVYKIS